MKIQVSKVFCKICKSEFRSFSTYFSLCLNCELFYCPECKEWQSRQIYQGYFKRVSRKCADCRGKKYKNKRCGSISLKMRFAVLLRDKFTCQYCGKNSQKCQIEVDHILPISKGAIIH